IFFLFTPTTTTINYTLSLHDALPIYRIIQQCFKQVLEPIAEAKFYNHSYGFRPQRSTHHAIARVQHLINHAYLHYVVDIDIKGFFDNINHTLLLKQLWNMGIQDKK